MTDRSDCPLFGKWFGCKFEGRYDTSAPYGDGFKGGFKTNGISAEEAVTILESLRAITYIRDVCVRCGRTVERAK